MTYEEDSKRITAELWDSDVAGGSHRIAIDGRPVGLATDKGEAEIVCKWLAGALADVEEKILDGVKEAYEEDLLDRFARFWAESTEAIGRK